VLERTFGVRKPIIAMPTSRACPEGPARRGGGHRQGRVVGRDLAVLQEAGVDGVMFCNEADHPYQLKVGPEIVAAKASVVGQHRRDVRIPYGINLLWDPIASLAVARATGATFIREVMTGVYESDLG
jgi:predicted TIM-barrel enzyme